jgi:hypothetical protein
VTLSELLRRDFFGEEGVPNLILIPSLLAVFPKPFQHYKKVLKVSHLFFFLEIEKLTLDPCTSFPPTTSSTVKISMYNYI